MFPKNVCVNARCVILRVKNCVFFSLFIEPSGGGVVPCAPPPITPRVCTLLTTAFRPL